MAGLFATISERNGRAILASVHRAGKACDQDRIRRWTKRGRAISLIATPRKAWAGMSGERDLRLDFFRGLALVFIFLDHIPSNSLNWLTIRNFGFSDATEMFVFISGYSAMLAYGGRLKSDGAFLTSARILKRCWQLYVAQLLLFIAYTAQIAYTAATFHNPMFAEEMNIVSFLEEPYVTLLQAMALKFRPANMDVLPLYIVLIGVFPLILIGLKRARWGVLGGALGLYVLARVFDWNLPAWPSGTWVFNPLRWQLLFVLGAWLGMAHGRHAWPGRARRGLIVLAAAYLLFSLYVVMGWHWPVLERYLPDWIESVIYPIDKTNLDPLRLAHFFAMAYLVVLVVPAHAAFLRWRSVRPLIRCGQHSLEIFCLGIFLSFTGHLFLVEIDDSLVAQAGVSMGGIALMMGVALYLAWYRRAERAAARAREIRIHDRTGELVPPLPGGPAGEARQ
jgi:hypothetical protein